MCAYGERVFWLMKSIQLSVSTVFVFNQQSAHLHADRENQIIALVRLNFPSRNETAEVRTATPVKHYHSNTGNANSTLDMKYTVL